MKSEKLERFLSEWHSDAPVVAVKTSGSTGTPKEMLVEKKRMLASARMTCDFLGLKDGDTALLCMSTDYIAGKMMVVRSIERNLRLTVVEPSNHPLKGLTEPFDFVAMIPSQVYETILNPEEASMLRRARNIIIGGGAVSNELKELLSDFPNAVWSTYGMTETLSHIALRRLNGSEATDWYTPFEGVSISLNEENCLVIDAPYVCKDLLTTNDIAEIRDGRFRILGRKDNVICSGGIKIQAEEVERQLASHLDSPFAITKKADKKFGEIVVLLTESNDIESIKAVCQEVLPRYWRPKEIIHTDRIPMTETGKIRRAALADLV